MPGIRTFGTFMLKRAVPFHTRLPALQVLHIEIGARSLRFGNSHRIVGPTLLRIRRSATSLTPGKRTTRIHGILVPGSLKLHHEQSQDEGHNKLHVSTRRQ